MINGGERSEAHREIRNYWAIFMYSCMNDIKTNSRHNFPLFAFLCVVFFFLSRCNANFHRRKTINQICSRMEEQDTARRTKSINKMQTKSLESLRLWPMNYIWVNWQTVITKIECYPLFVGCCMESYICQMLVSANVGRKFAVFVMMALWLYLTCSLPTVK